MTADFQSVYGLRLDDVIAEGEPGRLYALVEYLPPDSALGREQGRVDPVLLMHEWMHTLVDFWAGKRVTAPALWRGAPPGRDLASEPAPEPKRIDTSDPDGIDNFFRSLHG